jgi:asparaginyl-tRNA synthetase
MDKRIVEILKMEPPTNTSVSGWIRSFRGNRFIALNDGSCMTSLQVVIDADNFSDDLLSSLSNGASIMAKGKLITSQGSGQKVELQAEEIKVYGKSSQEDLQKTILQPKTHTLEKLREQGHLRMRTNLFGAVFRIRHHMAFAINKYFNDNGFFYIHTPIITGTDAEGAGETFRVTTLPLGEKNIDESKDFFGKPTHLTVSGQLEAELAALALGKVYTFGPTFRAENSNTTRHLAEFWMVEPEIAFADINDDINLGEDFLKYLINYALKHCLEDLQFLNDRAIKEESQMPKDKRNELSLLDRMKMVTDYKFERVSYTEAIEILIKSKPNKKKKFKYKVEWGIDLQSEHEKFLVEKHFKKPIAIVDYPASIKAFYMRKNDDGKTVAAMDILFPGIGEIIGGSQREERHDVLEEKCKEFNIPKEAIWWYLETRKFGTVPHAGFGLGFERLMMFVTGMSNIRDVIPFPRTPNNAEF